MGVPTRPSERGGVVGNTRPLPQPHGTLERLLRQQRSLAWISSTLTLATTVAFFTLMSLDVPLLSRIAFGRAITVANVVGVSLILASLASIGLFEWQARQIEEHLRDPVGRD
jgi:uncharacterized membrane protein (DUF485 family)